MAMRSEFGDLLLRLLEQKRVSQYQLSRAANLGPETISRLISGERPARERHALRIAIALFMEPWQIDATNDLLDIADAYTFTVLENGAGEPDAG